MLSFAGSSYALFAAVWSVMCLLAGALVTDSMLRGTPPATEAEHCADAATAER